VGLIRRLQCVDKYIFHCSFYLYKFTSNDKSIYSMQLRSKFYIIQSKKMNEYFFYDVYYLWHVRTHFKILREWLEFYHDGGLMTSKQQIPVVLNKLLWNEDYNW
jgi:hypothetical protein